MGMYRGVSNFGDRGDSLLDHTCFSETREE